MCKESKEGDEERRRIERHSEKYYPLHKRIQIDEGKRNTKEEAKRNRDKLKGWK